MEENQPPYEITEREQQVLKMLVDQYISQGQPVGSRTLSKLPGVDISAASVRNVMGDLEQMGLLKSPHTSAGRVPTSRAYRIFVDTLIEIQPPDSQTVLELREALDPALGKQSLIQVASQHLSGVTTMAGMVTVPKGGEPAVRQIEFVPLSEQRVLAILISDDAEVENRIIKVARDYSKSELEEIANFLNREMLGRPLAEMRDIIRAELEKARSDMNQRMQSMIEFAGQIFSDVPSSDIKEDMIVAGETNLMAHADLSNLEKLKSIFDAFQQKSEIFHILERCVSAEGVEIFIGRESGYDILDDCSLVTAPYGVDGNVVGVLGVIGPKRMAYDRVIPVVDLTSKLLSAALNSSK